MGRLLLVLLVAGCSEPEPEVRSPALAELTFPAHPPPAWPDEGFYGRLTVRYGEETTRVQLSGEAGRVDRGLTRGFPCSWVATDAEDGHGGSHDQWFVLCRVGETEDVVLQVVCPGIPSTTGAGPVSLRSGQLDDLVTLELDCLRR